MHFLYKVLYLSLFIYKSIHGFNIRNINSLQNIVSTKAITSAISERFNVEAFNENIIINDIMHHNTHVEADILYFALITGSLLYRSNIDDDSIKKLEKFSSFSTIRRRTNKCLFILAIVFTRSIENAI
jgi:hypothetical protein